jgi:hypothetical protein
MLSQACRQAFTTNVGLFANKLTPCQPVHPVLYRQQMRRCSTTTPVSPSRAPSNPAASWQWEGYCILFAGAYGIRFPYAYYNAKATASLAELEQEAVELRAQREAKRQLREANRSSGTHQ